MVLQKETLGEDFQFVCSEHDQGKSYFFHYNSTVEQYQLVYNSSHKFINIIENYDDAGEYCCSKHEISLVERSFQCCIQVESTYVYIIILLPVLLCIIFYCSSNHNTMECS